MCNMEDSHFHIFISYYFTCHLRLVKDSSLILKMDMCLRQTIGGSHGGVASIGMKV